tara:strand:- start:2624 stop:3760 length:1137 start_codon:yes stop_codon:yes gene_type:complete
MKKKVVHIISLSAIGGVQTSFESYYNLAKINSKYEHLIYSLHKLNRYFNIPKEEHRILNFNLINWLQLIFHICSKNSYIHFHNKLANKRILRLLNFLPSNNIIFHEYGGSWSSKKSSLKLYEKSEKVSSIIIACSNAAKILLNKKFKISNNKIKVVYHTGLLKKINEESKNQRYSNSFSVGFIGRFDSPKGTHLVIEVAKKMKYINFYIAGYGPLEKSLKIRSKGLNNVFFIGVKDPMDFIPKIDVLVVPSIREPLGNVIIEAGFCKKAVIAAGVDGITEIINDNINGILIEPKAKVSLGDLPKSAAPIPKFRVDVEKNKILAAKQIKINDFKQKLDLLQKDDELRSRIGVRLNDTVMNKFTIKSYFCSLEKIYDNIN